MAIFIFFKWVLVAANYIIKESNERISKTRSLHDDLCDANGLGRTFPSFHRYFFDGIQHVLTTYKFTKYGMLFVEMGCGPKREIPLRAGI